MSCLESKPLSFEQLPLLRTASTGHKSPSRAGHVRTSLPIPALGTPSGRGRLHVVGGAPVAFEAGQQFQHYRLIEKVGEGGMGAVWKAVDTRLDRTVAIKVIRHHLSGDARHRERFEREARAISNLNHPHICTLHDVGRHGDIDFLVMEYLDGEVLSDRLKHGALPLKRALVYGVDIAEALHEAHRLGIIHRDLKPGNIMLTKAGPKLLDFGRRPCSGSESVAQG